MIRAIVYSILIVLALLFFAVLCFLALPSVSGPILFILGVLIVVVDMLRCLSIPI